TRAPAVMVERDVSGDLEQPGPDLAVRRRRDRRAADPHEHVLGQVARGVRLANRPAEIPEQAILVGGEQRFRIGWHRHTYLRTQRAGDPLIGVVYPASSRSRTADTSRISNVPPPF